MLCKKPFDGFMHSFSIMTSKLQEIYQMITFSGNVELELVDSLDPVSEGVNFRSASPTHILFFFKPR
jgi:structural maintenance of chromosome 4